MRIKYNINLRGILLGIPFVIPLLSTFNTVDANIHVRFIAWGIYLVFAGFIILLKGKEYNFAFSPVVESKLSIIYLSYIGFSSVGLFYYGINLSDGVFEWLKIILCGIMILYLSVIFAKYKNYIQTVSISASLLSLIVCGVGIWQFYELKNVQTVSHQSMYLLCSTFAHKNIFAEILLISLPFAFFTIFTDKLIWKILGIVASFLIISFIIILLSRAVWMAFVASFFITGCFYFILKRGELSDKKKFFLKKKALLISGVTTVAIIASLLLYSKLDTFETFYKQATSIFNVTYGSSKDRVELWKKSLKIFKEYPITGSGLGSWKIEILKQGNKNLITDDNITFHQRPHNDYIWILTEQGILGLLLYLSFIAIVYFYLFKILKKVSGKEWFFFLCIFFALTSYLILSLFSFPKERIEHIIFLAIIISSIIIYYNRIFKQTSEKVLAKPPVYVITGILTLSVIVGFQRQLAEVHTRNAYDAKNKSDWPGVISEIDKANSFFYTIDPMCTPLYWHRGMANYNLNRMEEAFFDFKKAFEVNPYHVHVLNNLGTCYEQIGKHKEAVRLFSNALLYSEKFDDARYNLCALYFNMGNFDSAYYFIRKVPFDTLNQKQKQFFHLVLNARLKSIIDTTRDEVIRMRLQAIYNTSGWSYEIYTKSVNNKCPFEKQLLLDVIYILEIIEKNSIIALQYKQKYKL